jgi:hypothetical protein
MHNDNTPPPPDPSREQDRKISDETMLGLTISRIARAIGQPPAHILIGALATLSGQAICASHRDPEKRRHNKIQFDKGLEASMEMYERAEKAAQSAPAGSVLMEPPSRSKPKWVE